MNIISPAPGSFVGDIFQRQVETDIAVSPANSARAMAGFITYQTLPDASSWCGWSQTVNGGKSWRSDLLPGFPQDTSPEGSISPLHGLKQCSDPVLAGTPPNSSDPAQIYYGGLGLTQGDLTVVFVATYADPDDGGGRFRYVRNVAVETGNPSFQGQVMDKPAIAVDPPSPGFPQGVIHFSWADFNGNSNGKFQTKIMYVRSTDGGRSFSRPVKINNTFNRNQGPTIAKLANGTIYIFWRTALDENGMQVVAITRQGAISSPTTVAGGAGFFPYDQPSLPTPLSANYTAARSNAFPAATADRNNRLLVAWQEYVDPITGLPASPGTGAVPLAVPKVVITSSSDGQTWAPRRAAVMGPAGAVQIQPVMKAGGGLISLFYYDSANDGRGLNFVPEYQQWVYTGSGVGSDTGIDRRLDVFIAQAALQADGSTYTQQDAYGTPVFGAPVLVSRYTRSTSTGQILPRTAGFPEPAINLPYVKTTSNGTVPFIGDYMGMVSSVEYLLSNGVWRPALEPGDYQARTIYTVWTDTRTVQFPGYPTPSINGNWGPYDPSTCVNPGTRNTKPFFSAISPGLIARWTGTARPLQLPNGATIPPEFTVTVENATSADRFFQITLNDGKPAEDWSLVQTPAPPATDPVDQNVVDVPILRSSSVTLGVYYRWRDSSVATPTLPVVITVQEVDSTGSLIPGGMTTSVTFAPSGSPIQLPGSTLHALSVSDQSVNSLAGVNSTAAQPSDTSLQNFGFKNFGFKNFPPDQDVTWSVSGEGLLPTSGNAFVNVSNAQDIIDSGAYEFNLFVYVTHSTPALFGCTAGQLRQDQIISNIPVTSTGNNQLVADFGFKNFGFKNFPPADIINATFVADQDGIKVTVRSNKDPNGPSLFHPTPTNGVVSEGTIAQTVNPGETSPRAAFNDVTPPLITPTVTEAGTGNPAILGPGGWYSKAVTVTWKVSDPGSGIGSSTGCDATTVGSGMQSLTCSATNGAGLSNSASVTIRVDLTPPSITPSINGSLGQNGWYTSSVTVTWNVGDPESGIFSKTGCDPVSLATETTGVTYTCSAINGAGLANSASVTIKIDLTPPVITPSVSGTLGLDGWYISNVSASWSASDPISGVASSTGCGGYSQTTDTTGTTLTCSATNGAGLTAARSVTIKRDATPPAITIAAPASNTNYLLFASVASSYTCQDATAGVASCSGPVGSGSNFSTSTLGQNFFSVNAADRAGNTASLSSSFFVLYNFILTPPKSPTQLGSAIPLVWQLKDANGAIISDLGSLVRLTAVKTLQQPASGACPTSLLGTSANIYNPQTGWTGNSNIRFLSSTGQFQVNWDTTTVQSLGAGCYTVAWQLRDDAGPAPGFQVQDPSRLRLTSVRLK